MKVAHVGPPLARQGGPAGYLYELQRAAARAGAADAVLFPPPAQPARHAAPPRPSRVRRALSRAKRAVGLRPRFYRPPDASLRVSYGYVESAMTRATADVVSTARPSLERALSTADVLFCHEAPVAELALDRRRAGQQVWLLVHCPMPLALYQTWSWGVPEKDWREIAELPDVRRWTRWELDLWAHVDRLVVPCAEAFDELVRVEPLAQSLVSRLTCVLSGASLDAATFDRDAARRHFSFPANTPVGLFIGSNQSYRGLDTLLSGLDAMDRRAPEGIVAVAGPPKSSLPSNRRLRALGRVSDVARLLAAVDFVVNVNRFSLFDLSTIEALEAGRPLLMHAVGGNETFRKLGAGCVMLPDLGPSTIAAGLTHMFSLSAGERGALGRASRACYDAHLTLESFWKRHAQLYG